MSEKENQSQDDNQFNKVKQKFSNKQSKNKNNPNDPNGGTNGGGFNFYWIYAIVAVLLLGQVFVMNSNLASTTYGGFQEMVTNNEVAKVVVFNEKTAEVWLKKDVARSTKYKNKLSQPWVGGVNAGPHLPLTCPPEKRVSPTTWTRFELKKTSR